MTVGYILKRGIDMSNVMLTIEELRELKHMCSDPFMEMGMNMRPKHLDCLKEHVATRSMKLIISFETHKAAQEWNKMHEAHIRKGGHLATIAISVATGVVFKSPKLSIVVGSVGGIAKDEIQARIWYPKMFENWLLTRHFLFRYRQFPSQQFNISWTDVIQNDRGEEQEKRFQNSVQYKVGGISGIPEKVVRELMAQFPVRTIKYE
jgi:hypothetical protein